MVHKHSLLLYSGIATVLLVFSYSTSASAQISPPAGQETIRLLPESPYAERRAKQRKPQRTGTIDRPMRIPSQQTVVASPMEEELNLPETTAAVPPPIPVEPPVALPKLKIKPEPQPELATPAPPIEKPLAQSATPAAAPQAPAMAEDAPPTVRSIPSARETYYALPDSPYATSSVPAKPAPSADALKATIEREPIAAAPPPPPPPMAAPKEAAALEPLPFEAAEELPPPPPPPAKASALPPLEKVTSTAPKPYNMPAARKAADTLPPITPDAKPIAIKAPAAAPKLTPPPSLPSLLSPDPQSQQAQAALSPETKRIVAKIPPNVVPKPSKKKTAPIAIDRSNERQVNLNEDVKTHEALGIKIEVKKPSFAAQQELEHAYNALIAGQEDAAVAIYEGVLAQQPNNETALFGLATAYHRQGKTNLARPLYGKLLAQNPKNREALNNFLALMAEESPEGALAELQKLEKTNPDFSPIQAQMALIYDKLGQPELAIDRLQRASQLSPENLSYRYDLAIMLDKNKHYPEAAALYRDLIRASEQGERIPGDVNELRQRLTFVGAQQP